jgi:hypothetical protein
MLPINKFHAAAPSASSFVPLPAREPGTGVHKKFEFSFADSKSLIEARCLAPVPPNVIL